MVQNVLLLHMMIKMSKLFTGFALALISAQVIAQPGVLPGALPGALPEPFPEPFPEPCRELHRLHRQRCNLFSQRCPCNNLHVAPCNLMKRFIF